jgi:hypothetical protein
MKTTLMLVTAGTVWIALACTGEGRAAPPASAPASRSQPASAPASVPASAPVVCLEANAVVALHDLGTVHTGSEFFVVYAVENAGEANVAIRQIRPDCECISAVGPPTFLAARGATRITARFVVPKLKAPDLYGSELIVRTDDPQRRTIRLRILCRVTP